MGYSHSRKTWKRKWHLLSIVGMRYYTDEEGFVYKKVGKNRLVLVKKSVKSK